MSAVPNEHIQNLVRESRQKSQRVDVMAITRTLRQNYPGLDFKQLMNLVLQEVYRTGGRANWDPVQPAQPSPARTVDYVRRPPPTREERKEREEIRARDAAAARREAESNAAAFKENMIRLRNLRLARELGEALQGSEDSRKL